MSIILTAKHNRSFSTVGISTPQEIYDQLSRDVYGQDEAKKALSMLAWHHLNGRASSLLLAGPTGSGKSALIEALKKIPGIEVRTLDGSRLQPDDFVQAGVRREIMGRISNIAMLKPMMKADFRAILDTPNLSPIDRVSAEYGVHISVSEELKDELAEMAFASGLGCRAVYSDLKRRLNDMMFADCTQKSLIL